VDVLVALVLGEKRRALRLLLPGVLWATHQLDGPWLPRPTASTTEPAAYSGVETGDSPPRGESGPSRQTRRITNGGEHGHRMAPRLEEGHGSG
jgi:hypothetical protein